MTDNDAIARVTLPNGVVFPVTIDRDARCTVHGGQPGLGCESCRDSIVNAIVGFKPLGGWQALHAASANSTITQPAYQPTDMDAQPMGFPAGVTQSIAEYDPPPVISEPAKNEDGFYVGFNVMHPPGVECRFHPISRKCSCGNEQGA